MKLIKNIQIKNEEIEGRVHFCLFRKDIDVMIEDPDCLEYAEKCANYLNELNDDLITHLCNSSIEYCNSYLEAIGEPKKKFQNRRDVLSLIYPILLIIPGLGSEYDPVVHLELNCEWEVEHGMEWIIRKDKVLYVGAFNGEDPLRDFTQKDTWNFA